MASNDDLRRGLQQFEERIKAEIDLCRAELRVMITSTFQREREGLQKDIEAIRAEQRERLELIDSLIKDYTALLEKQKIPKVSTGPLFQNRRKRWAARLMELIDRQFNLEELQELCYEFDGLEWENFQGSKKQRVIGIVDHFYRRDTLDALASYCQMVRPVTLWPLALMDIPPAEKKP
jgi:hypothetical protein